MRLGISALAGGIEKAVRTCVEKGLNHIEIGIDNIEDWEHVSNEVDSIVSAGISLGVHLPMELNPCERVNEIRACWERFVLSNVEIGRQFGVRYYNMHLGYALERIAFCKREVLLENACSFLSGICNKLDSEIVTIENSYSNGGDLVNLGTRTSDFGKVLDSIKSEKIGFCFDTGHNLICEDEYLQSFGSITRVVHLSGNDGARDLHLGISRDNGIGDELLAELLGLQRAEYYVLEMDASHYKSSISKINELVGRQFKVE